MMEEAHKAVLKWKRVCDTKIIPVPDKIRDHIMAKLWWGLVYAWTVKARNWYCYFIDFMLKLDYMESMSLSSPNLLRNVCSDGEFWPNISSTNSRHSRHNWSTCWTSSTKSRGSSQNQSAPNWSSAKGAQAAIRSSLGDAAIDTAGEQHQCFQIPDSLFSSRWSYTYVHVNFLIRITCDQKMWWQNSNLPKDFVGSEQAPCSGPQSRHLHRRGLGQTDENKGDVEYILITCSLTLVMQNFGMSIFVSLYTW